MTTTTASSQSSAPAAETPDDVQHAGIKRWAIPFALLCCVILSFFDKISIAVLLSSPAFQGALGVEGETTKLGFLMTGFLLSYGFSSMFLGFLSDIISPKKCLYAMLVLTAVIMTIMGFAESYAQMLTLRIVLGIAEGPMFAIAYTIVKRTFAPREQARATMLWLLGTPIGASIGFPFTIYILDNFGWRATFFAMALLTIPLLMLVVWVFRKVDVSTKSPLQKARGDKHVPLSSHRHSTRELFGNISFWAICVFNIAFLAYLWGLNSWLPTYLVEDKGIDLDSAGIFSSLPFIAMLVGEVVGAFVSDRFDKRALMCAFSLFGAGLGLLLVLSIDASNIAMISAMSFSAMCWGVGAPNIFALLAKATPAKVSATAGGILNGFGNFSGALTPVIIGALIASTGNMTAGLLFMAVLAFAGAAVLLPLVRRY